MATQFLFEGGLLLQSITKEKYTKIMKSPYDAPLALLLHNYGVSIIGIKRNSSQ